ncbi:MAG: FIST N-terminal domain-containing protein, partial [Syntrophobacteraceae bacterium]
MRIEQEKWTQPRGWTPELPGSLAQSAQLVLLFGATAVLDRHEVIEQIRCAYPSAHVLGCSTAGEICGVQVSDDSCVATAVHFEHTEIRGCAIRLGEVQDSFHA